jgi:hypothetical protein
VASRLREGSRTFVDSLTGAGITSRANTTPDKAVTPCHIRVDEEFQEGRIRFTVLEDARSKRGDGRDSDNAVVDCVRHLQLNRAGVTPTRRAEWR